MADQMERGERCQHGIRGRCVVCENDELRAELEAVRAERDGLGEELRMAHDRTQRPTCTCGIEWVLSERQRTTSSSAIRNPVTVAPEHHAEKCPVRLWGKVRD